MVQSMDGAKLGWCKARMLKAIMAQIKDGAKRGWRKARMMLHSKDDTKQG